MINTKEIKEKINNTVKKIEIKVAAVMDYTANHPVQTVAMAALGCYAIYSSAKMHHEDTIRKMPDSYWDAQKAQEYSKLEKKRMQTEFEKTAPDAYWNYKAAIKMADATKYAADKGYMAAQNKSFYDAQTEKSKYEEMRKMAEVVAKAAKEEKE